MMSPGWRCSKTNCDSLTTILRERSGMYENINRLQREQLESQHLLLGIISDEREELKRIIEEQNKKIKKQATMRTVGLVIAVILTAGIILTVLLKK